MFGYLKLKFSDEKEITKIVKDTQGSNAVHASQVADEFAPVEHPMEPPETDQPVRCPPPEPCIIHDGRLWKERLQLSMRRRKELPFTMRESGGHPTMRREQVSILPSMSAPAHSLLNLLDS